MKLPVKTAGPVIGVVSGLVGLGVGFGLGALARQPEINALQKQVRKLQKKNHELKLVVQEQNDELAELLLRYQSLKAWQLLQKKSLKNDIKERFIIQYGMHDYFSLMLDRLETGRDFQDKETAFYAAFSRMLDDKRLSEEQEERIRSYVLGKHAREVRAMSQCDVSLDIDLINAVEFDERKERERGFGPLKFWKQRSGASEQDVVAH
ncbi:hypothetical protein [Thermophilibacter sp.]